MKKKRWIVMTSVLLCCFLLGFGITFASAESKYPLPVLEENLVYYEDFEGFESGTILTNSNYNQFTAKNSAKLNIVDNTSDSNVPEAYGKALKITTAPGSYVQDATPTLLETSNMAMKLDEGFRYYVTLNVRTDNVTYFQIVVYSGIAPSNPAIGFIGGGALNSASYLDVSVWEGFPRIQIESNTADSTTGFERITFYFEVRDGENPFLSFNFREASANAASILISEFSIQKSGVSYQEDFESYASQDEYFKYSTPAFNPYYKIPPFISEEGVVTGFDRGGDSFAIGAESASLYFTGLGNEAQNTLVTFGISEQFSPDGSKTGTTVDRQLFAVGKKNYVQFEYFLFGGENLTAEILQAGQSLGKVQIKLSDQSFTSEKLESVVVEQGTRLAKADNELYALRTLFAFDAGESGEIVLKLSADVATWGKLMIDNLRISNILGVEAPVYQNTSSAEINADYSGMDYLAEVPLLDKMAVCYSTVAAEGNELEAYRANGTSLFINFIDENGAAISSDGYTFARIADKYMIYPGSYRLSMDVRSSDVGALRFLLIERGEGAPVNISHAYFHPQNFAKIADATPSMVMNHAKNKDGSSHLEIYFATDKAAYMDISAKLFAPQSVGMAPWLSIGNLKIESFGELYEIDLPADTANGSVSADKQSAAAGERVMLTITPDVGYQVGTVSVNGMPAEEQDGKYFFTMPAERVQISVEFTAIAYDVTVETVQNGSVSADKLSAAAGETVTLTVVPDTGYKLASLSVNGESVNEQEGVWSFVMPAQNATVKAKFEAILYTVTAQEIQNGTVSADKQSAAAGEIVTISVTPAQGYKIVNVKVNGTEVVPQEGIYAFTMPLEDVQITAEFTVSTFKVTLPQGEGFTAEAVGAIEVAFGGEFCFKVLISEGYNGEELSVKAGGKTLIADSEGVYTVQDIQGDIVITVSGIVKNETGGCNTAAVGMSGVCSFVAAALGCIVIGKKKRRI